MSPLKPELKPHKEVVIEEAKEAVIEEEVETEEEAVIEEVVEEEVAEEAEVVVKEESQDSTPTETQSRRESTDHTLERQEKRAILMIENPEPEEAESQMTRRADTEDSTMVTSQLTSQRETQSKAKKRSRKRRSTRSQSQSQSQRWSNSLSPSTSTWPTRPSSEERKPELPMPSREPRSKLVVRNLSNPLFCKTSMPRTPLPLPLMPTTSTSVSELLPTMMMSQLAAEEEEVEEAAEAAEVMPVPEEEEPGDKTLSKPLRRPKKNSQHYERDGDPFDQSKELADFSASFR